MFIIGLLAEKVDFAEWISCKMLNSVTERNAWFVMNRKILNIVSIVLLIVGFLFVLSPDIYAGMPNMDELKNQADIFEQTGKQNAAIDANKIASIINPLASILLGIGSVVLVVVTAVMGVKYMAATPDARAKLKTQLIGIAVSAIVLFGAYGIWEIAYTIMTSLTA